MLSYGFIGVITFYQVNLSKKSQFIKMKNLSEKRKVYKYEIPKNNMKNKKILIIPIVSVLILSAFIIGLNINQPEISMSNSDALEYNSWVCTQVQRADGTSEPVECSHNTLFDTGAEYVETQLKTGSADAVDWISLCNASANAGGCGTPVADSSESWTEIAACGLTQQAGTTMDNGNGNWSVYYTFTSTCDDVVTNVTHLENDADLEFAGNAFTTATLQTDDTILVNWTIWATDGS